MLKITIPNNNINERKYIIDIIFTEFLDLEYRLKIGSSDYEILLGNEKKLTIKDTFFNNYPKELEYLKLDNIPKKIEELDIFAASFFMLSRWEEYVNKNRDIHDRFPASESLAFKEGFLDRPIVNEYLEALKKQLFELDNSLKFKERKFELMLTHDVDIPLKYTNASSGVREILGDILKRRDVKKALYTITQKTKVLLRLEKDPYDTFDYLMDISDKVGVKSYFFFMGKGETKYDNFYRSNDKFISELISKIKKRGHYIGIHPTYNAYTDTKQFQKEKEELEKNLDTKITFGREHYLRFEVPTTWQVWEDNNMLWDSTCGYADKEGFRCGTGDEFSVFNILTRKKLKLKERPLVVMDCSLFDYNTYSYKRAKEKIDKMKKNTNSFTILWHNSYIKHIAFYKEYLKGKS